MGYQHVYAAFPIEKDHVRRIVEIFKFEDVATEDMMRIYRKDL